MLLNRRIFAAITAVLFICATAACASTQLPIARSARYHVLRALIKQHVYLNLHCWCRVIDPFSLKRDASPSVSVVDAPILVTMLSERNRNVAWGAQALLEQLGPQAVSFLRPLVTANGLPGLYACAALQAIDSDNHKRLGTSPYLDLDALPIVGSPLLGADPCAAYADNVQDRRSIHPDNGFFHVRAGGQRLFVMTGRHDIVISVGPE
jgi:hypothetical protein